MRRAPIPNTPLLGVIATYQNRTTKTKNKKIERLDYLSNLSISALSISRETIARAAQIAAHIRAPLEPLVNHQIDAPIAALPAVTSKYFFLFI